MGHRANFVVIENNAAKAYYDQWAAMGCIYSFADGPDIAVDALSEMEEVTELMDWAFAEGGYLIDYDRNFAIVFGVAFEEDEAFEEMDDDTAATMLGINNSLAVSGRAYLEHIAPAWRGWKISWDDRGVDALAAYLSTRQIASIGVQPSSHPPTTKPPETIQA